MEELLKNWQVQINKGFYPYIILKSLISRKQYGYSLIVSINDQMGLNVSEGTIYPILIRLNEIGLINSEWVERKSGIPRKYYELSENGMKTIEHMEFLIEGYVKQMKQIS
ncbi:PadR family transcriptional regulator PadR [Pedobacter cryoconitis]|uniref:PadR family transcriptional regulator PadR n=1 Tax=Pedobacter cryoconitis TaxID=188932 RepID=A0A7W9DYF3_9SPHI|nr:PadR family transcriptional regulator [Pedobacter cryoconitis]MBB5634480.1 PadR family transcriptional regulator PadR [Pedobacter cryoconitis]MBB6272394.1 PadR family transcriptional regulator PadR [Pedobacter cryoconitis]